MVIFIKIMVKLVIVIGVNDNGDNDHCDNNNVNGNDNDNDNDNDNIKSPALMIDLAPTLLHIAGLEDQGIEVFVINHYQTL